MESTAPCTTMLPRQPRPRAGVCGIRLYVEQDNTTAQQVYESLDMYRTRYQMYEVEF